MRGSNGASEPFSASTDMAPATTAGKNYLPRVAAKLDVPQISEILEVVSPDTFKRPIYAGNGMATVKSSDAKKVITVRAASFDPVAADGGSASVEAVSAGDLPGISTFVSAELSKSERPELTAARIVISGGRGMQSGENFKKYIEPVADKLFNTLDVDGFFLEYDDERSGDFAPIRFVPKNKRVVLGLLTTKDPNVEDAETVKKRIVKSKNSGAAKANSRDGIDSATSSDTQDTTTAKKAGDDLGVEFCATGNATSESWRRNTPAIAVPYSVFAIAS